ncbi:hypothetical protein ACFL6C_07115 [Myxococcota bacterium]
MVSLLLLVSTFLVGPAEQKDVENEIVGIRREFKTIQSQLSEFKRHQRVLLGISAEGASITAYRDGEKVRKITVEALGETGKYLAEFFYNDEKLFFAFMQVIDYGGHIMETLEGKKLKNDVREEDRLYFVKDDLVRWLRFKKQIPPPNPDFAQKRKSVLAQAQSFLLLMKTPAPKKGEDTCDWNCGKQEHDHCVKYVCD